MHISGPNYKPSHSGPVQFQQEQAQAEQAEVCPSDLFLVPCKSMCHRSWFLAACINLALSVRVSGPTQPLSHSATQGLHSFSRDRHMLSKQRCAALLQHSLVSWNGGHVLHKLETSARMHHIPPSPSEEALSSSKLK